MDYTTFQHGKTVNLCCTINPDTHCTKCNLKMCMDCFARYDFEWCPADRSRDHDFI